MEVGCLNSYPLMAWMHFCDEAHLDCRLWSHVQRMSISHGEALNGPYGVEVPSKAKNDWTTGILCFSERQCVNL